MGGEGPPRVEKVFFSFSVVPSNDAYVDLVNSTSGYLEYLSVRTSAYSPQKSVSTTAHGVARESRSFEQVLCGLLIVFWVG